MIRSSGAALLRFDGGIKRHPAVEAWLHERPGALGALARRWFAVMRDCGEDIVELLHDGQPTACIGDAAFGYVDSFTAHVNVGFFRGAELADPSRLLQGDGRFMRHVKLRTGEDVDEAALRALIDAAYLDMKARLAAAGPYRAGRLTTAKESAMSFVQTSDGTGIFYKDWGSGQPVVFHHGWPLCSDDWDAQLMYFLSKGFRVIAHDRRGHGRSAQTFDGNEMNTYAADVAALAEQLDLRNAVHIGHSTGGGEVARYVAQYGGGGRVAKAVLIGAVPPVMVKSEKNPGGLPIEVFDGFRAALVSNRAQFYRDVPSGPFYGFNRPGAKVLPGVIDNWWRQGMMGGIKPQYDCIKAFSETDFTDDLKKIDVPTLVMHGDDDQIVPIADSAMLSAKLLRRGTLKIYKGLGHGLCTINADVVNADLLAFIRE